MSQKNFLKNFNDEATRFLTNAFLELEAHKVDLPDHWHIDHICYRSSTQDSYINLKNEFSNFAELLIESEIAGRLIATFKLLEPIVFANWQIDLIELPAPKDGKPYSDGFEHFEVVCDLSFDEIKRKYANCRFSDSGLSKSFNQELQMSFENFAIKFHHLSLASVINLESNTPVFLALKESNILNELRNFNPLVAGTFPLNLANEDSDLDILVSATNLLLIEKIVTDKFHAYPDFKAEHLSIDDQPSLLINFSFQGIPFEVFAQETPSIRQRAYLHFLIEERILKLGGAKIINKINSYRKDGLKTEPAFSKALNIQGDPYLALLDLQQMSNFELLNILKNS